MVWVVEWNTSKAVRIYEFICESKTSLEICELVKIINKVEWTSTSKNAFFRFELYMLGSVVIRRHWIVVQNTLRASTWKTTSQISVKAWNTCPDVVFTNKKWNKAICKIMLILSAHGSWQYSSNRLNGTVTGEVCIVHHIGYTDFYTRNHETEFLKSVPASVVLYHLTELF